MLSNYESFPLQLSVVFFCSQEAQNNTNLAVCFCQENLGSTIETRDAFWEGNSLVR